VINDKSCTPGTTCKRGLDIYLGTTKVELRRESNVPVVHYGSDVLTLPTSRDGTVFEKLGAYIMIRSNLGFMVRWDGRESIFVAVTTDHKGNTCGLCGRFDGDKTNDFETDSGKVVSSASSFASTWKRAPLGSSLYK